MLFREDAGSWLAVAQPSHSWVSGQLAEAWGNEAFGGYAPREEVRMAATLHDIGWMEWEEKPVFNPATGRPFSFMELPTSAHLRIWQATGPLLLAQGRYAALLASFHGTGLYERLHDYSRDTPEEVAAVKAYMAGQKAFQEGLMASLRTDPVYAPRAGEAAILRNRRLMAAWDLMSLILCFGRPGTETVRGVPAAEGAEDLDLTLTTHEGDAGRVEVDPWPFQEGTVTVVFDARRMTGTFPDEATMRAALDAAAWEAVIIRLEKK